MKDKIRDWTFDIGKDANGLMVVEPYASTIFDCRFADQTRSELIELRQAITRALRQYPSPLELGNEPWTTN